MVQDPGLSMRRDGLRHFAGQRVLLLQGPMGPFFWRLAADLRAAGAEVFKINFNGGDWLFYPLGASAWRGSLDAWPAWLEQYVRQHAITTVLLFGDCRPIHVAAREVALRCHIDVGVFEEGYVRPDFVTFERFGVNGYSQIPREAAFYQALPDPPAARVLPVGNSYWHGACWSTLYYLAAGLLRPLFLRYRHHRVLGFAELPAQLRGLWRKLYYAISEYRLGRQLVHDYSQRYFLLPLQVHNDAQVQAHSHYGSVARFIVDVIYSFARHAPADSVLVIKHHPLDRAYHDYGRLISRLARRTSTSGRVFYIHDQHLPTLLQHARGVIVINSTVGLSALYHQKAVKVCGTALYDMAGLTWQGKLADFWHAAPGFIPDAQLFQRFRSYLIERTQINGSFFRRIRASRLRCGLIWRRGRRADPAGPHADAQHP